MDIAALDFTAGEESLLDRAVYVCRQKNMTACTPEEAITEALGAYLALFEPRYGQPDELSRAVVHGSRHGRTPVTERSAERSRRSLDEVARLLVNGHRPPAPAPAADLDEVARRLVQGDRGTGSRGDRERATPPPHLPTSRRAGSDRRRARTRAPGDARLPA